MKHFNQLSIRMRAALLTAALVAAVLLLIVSIILLPQWFAMTIVILSATVTILYIVYRLILAVLEDMEAARRLAERNNYKQPPTKP